jgi:hypothetical protein
MSIVEFTCIFFKRDWVVLEMASRKGVLRLLARSLTVSAVRVKHVVMLFKRIWVTLSWGGILVRITVLEMSGCYNMEPWEFHHIWLLFISRTGPKMWCSVHIFRYISHSRCQYDPRNLHHHCCINNLTKILWLLWTIWQKSCDCFGQLTKIFLPRLESSLYESKLVNR